MSNKIDSKETVRLDMQYIRSEIERLKTEAQSGNGGNSGEIMELENEHKRTGASLDKEREVFRKEGLTSGTRGRITAAVSALCLGLTALTGCAAVRGVTVEPREPYPHGRDHCETTVIYQGGKKTTITECYESHNDIKIISVPNDRRDHDRHDHDRHGNDRDRGRQ